MESISENNRGHNILSILIGKLHKISYSKTAFKDSLLTNVGDDEDPLYIDIDNLERDTNEISAELQKIIESIRSISIEKEEETNKFFIDKNYKQETKDRIFLRIEYQISYFLHHSFPDTRMLEIEESFLPVSGNSIISYHSISLLDKVKFKEYINKLITLCSNFKNLKLDLPLYIHIESSYVPDYSIEATEGDLNDLRNIMTPNSLSNAISKECDFLTLYIINNFEYSKKNGILSVIIDYLKRKLDFCKKLSIYNINIESINNLTEEDIFKEIVEKYSKHAFPFELVHKEGRLKCYDSDYRSLKYRLYNDYINDVSSKYSLQIFKNYNENKDVKIIFNIDNFLMDLDHKIKSHFELIDFPTEGTSLDKFFKYNIDTIKNDIDKVIPNYTDNNISFSDVEIIRSANKLKLLENIKDGRINEIGYKANINLINDNINLNKVNRLVKKYNLDSIPEYLLERFIKMYKEIAIKELQENEKFLQGKTDSIKIFNKIKYKGTPINNLNLKLEKFNYSESFLIEIIPDDDLGSGKLYISELEIANTHYFYLEIFDKIFLHLSLFKNEIYKLLEITDLNKLKDYIINIINFQLPNENRDKMHDMETYHYFKEYDEYFKEKKDLIFKEIDSDENKRTKNEKFNLYYQALKLFHNNEKNKNFVEYIINSRYLSKLNSAAVIDIFGCFANIYKINDIDDSLETIIKEKPKLLPNHIYTDFIKNIIDDILNAKSDNYIELDKVFEKLLSIDSFRNVRMLKYVTSLAVNYEAISNWMDLAKEKEKDVFSANFSTESFRFRVLEDFDPYHFQVGMETDCCQTIGGQGESAAVDSFINPKAGVVVLEANNGGRWNLAAQSYFHVFSMNKDGKEVKGIILDNIEAGALSSRYGRDNFYPKAYAILGKYLKSKGFDIVGCGKDHTRIIGKSSFALSSIAFDPRHFEVEENNLKSYTDFNHESFYDLLKPAFAFEMPSNIDSEVKMAKYNNVLLKLSKFLINTKLEKEAVKVYNLIY